MESEHQCQEASLFASALERHGLAIHDMSGLLHAFKGSMAEMQGVQGQGPMAQLSHGLAAVER